MTEHRPDRSSIEAFIKACLPPMNAHRGGSLDAAREMLVQSPSLAHASIVTGTLLGQDELLTTALAMDRTLATSKFAPHDWPLLLYLCFSLFYRDDRALRPTFHRMAERLLDAGADPRACFMLGDEKETALYGATGIANDAVMGAMLLDAGADVDDEDAAYHIAEHDSCDAIKLMFARGMSSELRVTTLLHKLDYEDREGVRTLLDLGADPNAMGRWGKTALHQAIMRGRSLAIIELLLQRGANADSPRKDGKTPYALAARVGRQEVLDLLLAHGADKTMSTTDQFLAACAAGDRRAVDNLTMQTPDLARSLSEEDHLALVESARDGKTQAVEMMLGAGMNVAARGTCGGTALHWAAWHGRGETVRGLVRHGAPVDCLCTAYRNSPLGWGVYGSTACRETDGDYVDVVTFLLEQEAAIEPYMLTDGTPPIEAILRSEAERRSSRRR